MKVNHKHPFHLVDPSPWPLSISLAALFTTFGGVLYIHGYKSGFELLSLGFFLMICVLSLWWRDVVREATYEGHHTSYVQRGLRIGISLFIVSEVIFFFAFFWAYFYLSLPILSVGGYWPPLGIDPIKPWGLPFLNTLLLLSSGFTLTWAQHILVAGGKKQSLAALGCTLVLALIFISVQVFEYKTASFSISDGAYGSLFYIITGFHGFHVLIGTVFLGVCALRLYINHFSRTHHVGMEAAAWYWHFVDIVWLFVFICIYWWPAK
jgi:cytochrome c oxidase subunit 3